MKRFLVFALTIAFAPVAMADFVEITASTDYSVAQKVLLNYSTPLVFDLSALPANALVQSAQVFISLSTEVNSYQPLPLNPVTSWDLITVFPTSDPPPGFESWSARFQQGASLDGIPVALNPLTPTLITPYVVPGGSLSATLTFTGENDVFDCNPDSNGDCNNGALEPPFGIAGEGVGTLDIEYTLPNELPEPGYFAATALLGLTIVGVVRRRNTVRR